MRHQLHFRALDLRGIFLVGEFVAQSHEQLRPRINLSKSGRYLNILSEKRKEGRGGEGRYRIFIDNKNAKETSKS